MTAPVLLLYSRAGCGLCEDLLRELRALVPGVAVTVVDVDEDPVLRRRYGLDVPVLVGPEGELCRHRLDAPAVLAWWQGVTGGIPAGPRG